MKKILLAAMLAGSMSVSAFATDGTVKEVQQYADGTTAVVFTSNGTDTRNIILAGDAELQKRYIALLLSAQAQNRTVNYSTCPTNAPGALCTLIIK